MAETVATSRPPLWRDVRVLRVLFQAAVVALVVGGIYWLVNNVITNLRDLGIDSGFSFLNEPTGFSIPNSNFDKDSSVWKAMLTGLANTIRLAVPAVILAQIFGLIIGIGRLSHNWLVKTACRVYVEVFRNTPLLLIVIFAYLAGSLRFPAPAEAWEIPNVLVITIRGVGVVWPRTPDGSLPVWLLLIGAAVAGWLVHKWRIRVFDSTGKRAFANLYALVTFVVVVAVGLVALGNPVDLSTPTVDGRRVRGGMGMSPEYAGIMIALVLYTTSHIAEIVRASIQSVAKGQTEAATALALGGNQRLRYVVLPQAARVALPPLINQYLNLTKNTSLAVAIAYAELTWVAEQNIGARTPAIQTFIIMVLLYLSLSVVIALFGNLAIRRMRLVER